MILSRRIRLPGHILILTLLALFSGGIAGPAASKTVPAGVSVEMDSGAFAREMERILAAGQKLGGDSAAAEELRSSLPEKWAVQQKGTRVRDVIPAELLKSLLEDYESHPANWTRLKAKFLARAGEMKRLGDALAEEAGKTAEGRAETVARPKIEKILARREFRHDRRPDPLAPWREKILRWLEDLVRRLFGSVWHSARTGEAAVWVMILLIFLVLAVWLGRHLAGSRLQSFSLEPPHPVGRTWRDWAREAREAARQGHHREAMHAAYWTAVYRLEELGAWSRDRARTPREYLGLLDARKERGEAGAPLFAATRAQQNALKDLTERFEVTWYGYRDAGESDFQHAVAQLEELGCRLS